MKELNDTEFHILGRTIKAPTLYAQNGSENLLVIYWICIDKELVNWTEQIDYVFGKSTWPSAYGFLKRRK